MQIFLDALSSVAGLAVAVILALAATVLFKLAQKALAKFGIDIEDKQLAGVKSIVSDVVKSLNQTIVSGLKEANPNSKLTEEQKTMVYSKAVTMITGLLNADQVKVLVNKYGDVDSAMKILVEADIVNNHAEATYSLGFGVLNEGTSSEPLESADAETTTED